MTDAPRFRGTDRFELLGRLGEGGMGVVFEARDRKGGGHVALKLLPSVAPDAILSFKQEFRALADLSHPNLVSLGELVVDGDDYFFTMELVRGVDFLQWVRPDDRFERTETPSADTMQVPLHLLERSMARLRTERPPTRVPRRFDEVRLRDAFGQLVRGLSALHGGGKVHRDIKPSNLLVEPTGRVVLLDFGLVADLDAARRGEGALVGTPGYMAPEQAASKQVGPPADWYSAGVLLYQSLTGRLPIDGPAHEVLLRKQTDEPISPRDLVEDVPDDLAELAMHLLRFDPAERPSGRRIARRLGLPEVAPASLDTLSSVGDAVPFVGRLPELRQLGEAFGAARSGAVSVLVLGESGVGKTALVRHFLDSIGAQRADGPVVLEGRCFERESVPYKALDGVVDELARWLGRRPRAEVDALLPRQAPLVAQVFPTLRRVEAIADAPRSGDVLDPLELRARVFSGLRALLERIAAASPLVIVVDDLQWADADSLLLLHELLRAPPPRGLLFVASVRVSDDGASTVASLGIPGDVRRIPVGRLAAADAEQLARTLASRLGGADAAVAAAIATETDGHPLFIDELVRHTVIGGARPGERRLEDALAARLLALEPPVRAFVELVALAGAPLVHEAAAHASGLGASELARAVAMLRVSHLLRSGGVRGQQTLEPYHDRIRQAALSGMGDEARRAAHRRLAVALEQVGGADAESLATHWRGAGEPVRAADNAVRAAEEANAALAFARAARLYRLALELHPEAPGARDLWARLGDALSNAGRGEEAARAYFRAIDGATAAEALELKRRAAEQLLISGHIDEGLEAIRAVLTALGMRLPESPRGALLSLVSRRALVRMRGLGFRPRDLSQVSAAEQQRIDACWSVSSGLAMTDIVRAADFQTRTLLLALKAGEPIRISRSLAVEGVFVSTAGPAARARAERLVQAAGELAAKEQSAISVGWAIGAQGTVHYQLGEWRLALDRLERAVEVIREHGVGMTWERDTTQLFALYALFWLGDLEALARRTPELLRDAEERGDRYLATTLRIGMTNLAWLIGDRPELAERHISDAMGQWSRLGFHLQHHLDLYARTMLDLYTGQGPRAWGRILELWPALESSLLLRVHVTRCEALDSRARAALATALASEGDLRAKARADALRLGKRLLGERAAWSSALGSLVEAGVHALDGEASEAAAAAIRAEEAATQAQMALHVQLARRLRGVVSDERALVGESDAWMRSRGVVRPERLAAVFTPASR